MPEPVGDAVGVQKKQDAVDRGAEAKRILESPLFMEAYTAAEAEIYRTWKGSGPNDHEIRHNAYYTQKALERVQGFFKQCVAKGDKARLDIEAMQSNEQPGET